MLPSNANPYVRSTSCRIVFINSPSSKYALQGFYVKRKKKRRSRQRSANCKREKKEKEKEEEANLLIKGQRVVLGQISLSDTISMAVDVLGFEVDIGISMLLDRLWPLGDVVAGQQSKIQLCESREGGQGHSDRE